MTRFVSIVLLSLALLGSKPAWAENEASGPNTGKISFSAGLDMTTQYLFRGIFQEDQGSILQPSFEVGLNLIQSDGPISSVDLTVGLWNSIHDGPTGSGDGGPGAWYEADLYTGLSFGLPGNLTFDLTYVHLGSPDPAGSIYAEEFDFQLSYNDSDLWNLDLPGFEGFQPYVLFVAEVDGASDGVGNGGDTYMEFGIAPSYTLIESPNITMTIPVAIGLSLDDYYESPIDGDDDTFGFFQAGLDFSTPLPFVSGDYGSWSAHAGVNFVFLGDTVEDFNDGSDKDFEVIGTFGISMEY